MHKYQVNHTDSAGAFHTNYFNHQTKMFRHISECMSAGATEIVIKSKG